MSGLGQSSQQGNTNSTSQTTPWAQALPEAGQTLGALGNLNNSGFLSMGPTDWQNSTAAQKALKGLPNPGTSMANVGQNAVNSGGDPYGILGNVQQSIGNINDPASSPGMQGLLNTIKTDTQNSVNSQFAGAGRSLSGMNEQTLARGLAQGEAAPLQAQYNSNLANLMGLSQQKMGNQQTGLQDLASAIPASQLPAQTAQQAYQMPFTNTAQRIGASANLGIPYLGLGGQTSGTGNIVGTSNASLGTILAQLMGGQGGGILGGGLGLAGTLGIL